ncbi:hypothetical protein BJY00DRAFT_29071 [Aspergillus carlsbadensis]|nr:hypothetical protein BJY00DRAFT_29071 [Aspergillus carlsbadensis]
MHHDASSSFSASGMGLYHHLPHSPTSDQIPTFSSARGAMREIVDTPVARCTLNLCLRRHMKRSLFRGGRSRYHSSALAAPVGPAFALNSLALDRKSRWFLHQPCIYRGRWCPICLANSAAFNQMLATYTTHVA